MGPQSRFNKTAKGAEEIESRKYKLAPRMRSVLLLVVNSKTAAEITEQAVAIKAPVDSLAQLVAGGFIEEIAAAAPSPAQQAAAPPPSPLAQTPTERFIAAHRFIDTTVTDGGGLKSYLFQLKLAKCGNMDELRAILPDYETFMLKHVGEEGARVYLTEIKRLVA